MSAPEKIWVHSTTAGSWAEPHMHDDQTEYTRSDLAIKAVGQEDIDFITETLEGVDWVGTGSRRDGDDEREETFKVWNRILSALEQDT